MKNSKFLSLCFTVAGLFFVQAVCGDDLRVSGEFTNNGLNVVVSAPGGFTNRVEIYACSNLLSGNWRTAAENLRPSGGSPAQWYTEVDDVGFFVAGNMDVDSDGDGLPDAREKYIHKTSSDKWDSSGDWLSDGWKVAHGLNPLASNRSADSDNDGLDNGTECLWGTDPLSSDSDGDGLPDLWEVNAGTDPLVNDAGGDMDNDGLTNYQEFTAGTNPRNPDTDEDGIPDGFEVHHGMNPYDPFDVMDDPDGDLFPNLYEYLHGSDPSNPASVPAPTAVVSTNGRDGTFTNIQAAVNAVETNDRPIIFIEPGNYRVDAEIELSLINVLIYAAPGSVVLDGQGSSRLFNVDCGRPLLIGLTLQNGYSTDDGGAIYSGGYALKAFNCVFQSNEAVRGGGVYCENTGTELINCTWIDNYAAELGGAVYGGSVIRNGRFFSNQSHEYNGRGGAIYSGGNALEVLNCVFQKNLAYMGGAVYCENAGTEMINCTWIGNDAGAFGAAIYGGSVVNGIVWSNRSLWSWWSNSPIDSATVSYSCVEDGYAGVANTTNDPGLVHGWHLPSAHSPCVNSGNATNAPLFDLEGKPRDILPDMGADEWVDSDTDGLPDWWEMLWFTNLNSVTDGNLPADGRMTYIQKYLYELDPSVSDYDGDGLSDYAEVFIYKTDPLVTNALDTSTGYTIEQTGYEWIDISQTGQAITDFSQLDDGSAQISLGMQFPFSDATYDMAYVCNNGFVCFGEESTTWGNEPLPSTSIPEKTLCVFWDDLRMAYNPAAAVYVQTSSSQCIISFEGIPFYYAGTARLSFQVILHADGSVLYQYKDVSSDGTLPTIGMQWAEGNVEFYAGNVTNGTALRISSGTDVDSDLDGVSDAWEKKWFGNLNTVTNGSDFVTGDHLFTYAEAAYLGLNPNVTDTDGDGLFDKVEVEHGTNPAVPEDSDSDGMPDYFETAQGLNLFDPADALADPDGDGFPNLYEYRHGAGLSNSNSVPSPDRYVSLAGQHIAPFTNRATAAVNLQVAMAAAAPYDIIQVADGTYTGPENRNLNFMGKPLMLFSENGPTNCILNGENAGRGLYIENGAGSFIRGIQFYQGFSDDGYSLDAARGGAVYSRNTRVLLENCWFRSNSAAGLGAAIYGWESLVILKNCVFENNGDENYWGGVCYFELSDVEMTGCTETGSRGDFGFTFWMTDFTVQNCVFSNNASCSLNGQGSTGQTKNSTFSNNRGDYVSGGAYFQASDVILSNCLFSGNSGYYGGAIDCEGYYGSPMGTLLAQNCIFSGNSSDGGRGVVWFLAIWARFENCTFFDNQNAGIHSHNDWVQDLTDITLRNTILWGNDSGSYNSAEGMDIEFCCLPEITGTNNVHTDPRLNPETGALLPNSPCIDRGSDLTAPVTDILGTPRWDHPWRSNKVDSSVADIGAFEFTDTDTDADGLGDLWEIYYFTNITFSSGMDDVDGDGLSTFDEYRLNTNPWLADTDGDGLSDGDEVNLHGTDPLSADSDGDGLLDGAEIAAGTNPLSADSDNDGLPDGWEVANSLNPLLDSDALADADSDGLTNLEEYMIGTDFRNSDTDRDGLPDGWEMLNGFNPLVADGAADADNDGLTNLEEYTLGTNLRSADTDSDGIPDKWEVDHSLNPLINDASNDSDSDGLTNLLEYKRGSDPHNPDTDGDGLSDGYEHANGTDPTKADSEGDGLNDNVDPEPWGLDSDGDGMPYEWEVARGLNPRAYDGGADADDDCLTNLEEYLAGTDPQNPDTDGDGLSDGFEVHTSFTSPLLKDTDSDLLSDSEEINLYHTNPLLQDTDSDGMIDWFEVDQGQYSPVDNLRMAAASEIIEPGSSVLSRSSSSDGVAASEPVSIPSDTDDDGQLDADEFHRWPTFTVNARVDYGQYYSPPVYAPPTMPPLPNGLVRFLFEGSPAPYPGWMHPAFISADRTWLGVYFSDDPWSVYSKTFFATPGEEYELGEISAITMPTNCYIGTGILGSQPRWVGLSSHFTQRGGFFSHGIFGGGIEESILVGDVETYYYPYTGHSNTYIYPYACNYRIEKGQAGCYDRRMSVPLNDDPSDTNKMGLVVFKQMIIHSNAPTPHIYLSASSELRLYRASGDRAGEPITFYKRGEPWDGCESIEDYNLRKPGFDEVEDIGAELRLGDLAVFVEGISPSSDPNQTADKITSPGGFGQYPPFYGRGSNPTSQGSWGTYVGLYCKDDVDRYPAFENDMIRFSVEVRPNIGLIPDWNRDRKIDVDDMGQPTNRLFRFWVNDDADNGVVADGDSDVPGQGGGWWPMRHEANFEDKQVNGSCDLPDFFPVWLNISATLSNYPPANGITYKLHCPGDALRFVYTDLANTNAGDYLIKDVASCGPAFNQNAAEAETILIPEKGVTLNTDFLNRIAANPNKGVLIMEAVEAIMSGSLLLTIVSNDTILAYTELPLCLSGVEYMFRHKNLRAEIGVRTVIGTEMQEGVDDRPAAPNEPDPDSTANLFFLHGFGVNERSARGWNAEMFKRLYWSGSKARFHGITWYGDKGGPANYQENVNHAFKTAPYLKDYVASVSGTKIMLAHSLGNMVVSSAIQDYGMSVQKYLMLDAAVPLEAYDASVAEPAHPHLIHPDWADYPPNSWSANWFKLFQGQNDVRSMMTWRGRFANVVSNAYNIYSSSDEVFDTKAGVSIFSDPDIFPGGESPFSHYAWQIQELLKGVKGRPFNGAFFGAASTSWAGWGFSLNWIGQHQYSPAEAAETLQHNPQSLIPNPVFRPNPAFYFHINNLTTNEINEMLANGIPALSVSVGRTSSVAHAQFGLGNLDLNTPAMRPNGTTHKDNMWFHNDMKDLPYLQTYKLYEILTQ